MRFFRFPVAPPCASISASRSAVAAALAAFVPLMLAAAAPRAANAQGTLPFSGGSGTPLTATLATPISYTITTVATTYGSFIFDGVGGSAFFSNPSTTTLSYQINGGPTQTISVFRNNFTGGNITADDVLINGTVNNNLNIGDILTLASGTITTNNNFTGTLPTSGTYTTFAANSTGSRISTNGVAVPAAVGPEPGSLPLLGMGLVTGAGMVGTIRRRKASHKA